MANIKDMFSFGNTAFSDLSGAVGDIFASEGHASKAQGDRLEAQNYDLAATLARQNEQFTKTSTDIKQFQIERESYQAIGGQRADVAGAGFAESGSAIDLLRSSAAQGALTKAVAGTQGLITEAGYEEQAQSYTNMASAARLAANAEDEASKGSMITGAIKGVAAAANIAALFI